MSIKTDNEKNENQNDKAHHRFMFVAFPCLFLRRACVRTFPLSAFWPRTLCLFGEIPFNGKIRTEIKYQHRYYFLRAMLQRSRGKRGKTKIEN